MEANKFNRLLRNIKDERSFGALYDFYYKRIVYHLKNRFGKEAAEDAAQKFFIKLLTDDKTYMYIERPTTWVYRCCENLAIDTAEQNNKTLSLDDSIECPQTTVEMEYFGVSDGAFDKAIKGLDETSRKLIYLHYWEGYSLRETAEILGLGHAAVRKRHGRIKAKLRNLLRS